MSTVEDVLRQALRDAAAVSALVGSRVFHSVIAEDESAPSLVINRISTQPVRAMSADAPLTQARIQVDAFAEKEADARALAAAVKTALDRYSTSGPPVVQRVFFDNEQGLFDQTTRRYQRALDFIVWFEEA